MANLSARKYFLLATVLLLIQTAPARAQGTRADYERARALPEMARQKVFGGKVDPHWFADGKRFWYQRDLSWQDLKMIQNTDLSDIIRRNSTTTNVQDNVFFFNVEITGRVFNDVNADTILGRGEAGLAGRTVSLLDDSGAVAD